MTSPREQAAAATSQPDPAILDRLRTADTSCPGCGYNLRGLADPHCPECGREFTQDDIRAIPRSRHDLARAVRFANISIAFAGVIAGAHVVTILRLLFDPRARPQPFAAFVAPSAALLACILGIGLGVAITRTARARPTGGEILAWTGAGVCWMLAVGSLAVMRA